MRLTRVAGLAALGVALTGCDTAKWGRFGWPAPVTAQGDRILAMWRGSTVAAIGVGLFVLALIAWTCLFHRRRTDVLPRQVRYNLPIEILYTVVPFVIIAVLFYFTAIDESYEDKTTKNPAVVVNVVGFQWSWQFNYVKEGLQVTGRPGEPPTLVIPVGEKIRFIETSPDVIHSWWVIPFLFKRDVIPGRQNQFEVTVTKKGMFSGKCAEYCGTYHSRMLFNVRAVSPADYQSFLASAKKTAKSNNPGQFSMAGAPIGGGAQ